MSWLLRMLWRRKKNAIDRICRASQSHQCVTRPCTVCSTIAVNKTFSCSNPSCGAQFCWNCYRRFLFMNFDQIQYIPFPSCLCCDAPFSIALLTDIVRTMEQSQTKEKIHPMRNDLDRCSNSITMKDADIAIIRSAAVRLLDEVFASITTRLHGKTERTHMRPPSLGSASGDIAAMENPGAGGGSPELEDPQSINGTDQHLITWLCQCKKYQHTHAYLLPLIAL